MEEERRVSEWKLRRGNDEWPVGDVAMLRQWTEAGKVSPSDYVFNPILQKWVYANEVAEINEIFAGRKTKSDLEKLNKSSLGLGCLGVLLLFLFWPAGVVVLCVAIAMSAWYHVKR